MSKTFLHHCLKAMALILLLQINLHASLHAQVVGDPMETYQRNGLLLSDTSLPASGLIRPFLDGNLQTLTYIELDGKDLLHFPQRRIKSYRTPRYTTESIFKPTELVMRQQYVSHHPYDWNDGAMLPMPGFQQLISMGVSGKTGNFDFRLSPEVVLAENQPFEGFTTEHDQTTWRDYYRYVNFIETPEKFGVRPLQKVYGGQSYFRYSLNALSAEISTANKWWGPGYRNALLLSNNAPGFPHLAIKSNQPISSQIGSFEFELLYGLLFNEPFPPADTFKVYRGNKLYKAKDNLQRVMKGFVLSYQPKWVPGLFLGVEQTENRYLFETRKFKDWLPFKKPFRKVIYDMPEKGLLLSGLFFKYRIPGAHAEIYGEWGWNQSQRNFRSFMVNNEQGIASVWGFRKMFKPQVEDGEEPGYYWELNAEITNLQIQNQRDLLVNTAPLSWYLHPQVRQGHTHEGQLLGSGTGPGGNSQFLEFNWRSGFNKIGFALERKINNNDFYVYHFRNSVDFRRYWVDYAATLQASWQFGHLLVNAQLSSIKSLNYNYWLFQPADAYFISGRDVNQYTGNISLRYFFKHL
jgi:hypothetical protein